MIKIENYIDGELVSNSDNYIDLYNPSVGKKYGQCPNSSIKDLNSSITSSENAFNEWSQFSFKKRSSFLFKIADLLENELDDFAKAESLDNGKPLSLSTKLDIPRAIENLRFFSDMVSNSQSAICKTDKIGDNYILKQPQEENIKKLADYFMKFQNFCFDLDNNNMLNGSINFNYR